jgi:hypothetical protein
VTVAHMQTGCRHTHINRMQHPQAEATYRVVPIKDASFGVEVITPDAEPAMVSSFATAADADAWISRQKQKVAEGVSRRHRGRAFGP